MKTLLLMRHAKSSWDDKDMEDIARPLSKRGRKNAVRMGELLKDEKINPDLILVSNANRARQTAELVIEALNNYQGDRCYVNKLYMAEIDVYAQEIRRISDDANVVLIIGHNPTLNSLLQMTTGQVLALPTGAIAHLSIAIDSWGEFGLEGKAELINLWRPKDL